MSVNRFYDLAFELEIVQTLKDNEFNYPRNVRRAISETLDTWVDKTSASWEKLIQALKNIGLNRLANELEISVAC